jgi:FKBP-type peptidyl-prolyl cis-trans isomerase FklB
MRMFTPSVMAGLTFFAGIATAAEPLKLEQEADRINYSIGHQIGIDFKRQGIALDRAAVARGIEDAFTGAAALMDKQDMETRLGKLKSTITDDMRSAQLQHLKERKEDRERKLLEAQTFLDANANKTGVTTLASGLQYRVIKDGKGVKPHIVDNVTIHYRGIKLSGQEFSNSYRKNQPRTVRVADMIPGIKEAILMMQPGAKWELFIPPELAYDRRSPIAYQAVIVELELLAVDVRDSPTAATPAADSAQNTPPH